MMVEGDKWKVHIPSSLAYGGAGSPPQIPPYATLVFEIELLEINIGNGKSQEEAKNMFSSALADVSSSSSTLTSSTAPLSPSVDIFPYEYRQTKTALSMIIPVSNIAPSSLKIKFNRKGCDICFQENAGKSYGMGK